MIEALAAVGGWAATLALMYLAFVVMVRLIRERGWQDTHGEPMPVRLVALNQPRCARVARMRS